MRSRYARQSVIAIFSSLGYQEMFLLLIIGLLLYGRNLPDAGRSLGRVVAQLKRSFNDFKDQMDRDGEIRDVKKAIKDTADELKNVTKVPTAMSNPSAALRNLTHEAMSSPIDDGDDASEGDVDIGSSDDGSTEVGLSDESEGLDHDEFAYDRPDPDGLVSGNPASTEPSSKDTASPGSVATESGSDAESGSANEENHNNERP